ncbi:hypothetical protein JTE90_026133 [Oedothorax gibbosus]|uniref:Uncharacterized protein n=1 Tax=Oedothorax gibbosus TaxID=931172 RepID=A0AAV6V000_9ARAC|nr:hypothetical protein JTE90_026133 [Oedothorax gibbosus]
MIPHSYHTHSQTNIAFSIHPATHTTSLIIKYHYAKKRTKTPKTPAKTNAPKVLPKQNLETPPSTVDSSDVRRMRSGM